MKLVTGKSKRRTKNRYAQRLERREIGFQYKKDDNFFEFIFSNVCLARTTGAPHVA
jgi:hypothetical protein